MKLPRWRTIFALATPLLTTSCAAFFPAPTPMRVLVRDAPRAPNVVHAKCLVVFLPGFGDDEDDIIDHHFIDDMRARHLAIDAISTGATFGYYAKRTLLTRLRDDVMLPARARGYEQIWYVGISMGGMGALLEAMELTKNHEPPLAGIYLIAPYLGDDDQLHEIANAGGLASWNPGPPSGDYRREVWRWLKNATSSPDATTEIYLGAGDKDKLNFGHRILSAALPPSHVFHTPGGHDWKPWSILWKDFLDHSNIAPRCAE